MKVEHLTAAVRLFLVHWDDPGCDPGALTDAVAGLRATLRAYDDELERAPFPPAPSFVPPGHVWERRFMGEPHYSNPDAQADHDARARDDAARVREAEMLWNERGDVAVARYGTNVDPGGPSASVVAVVEHDAEGGRQVADVVDPESRCPFCHRIQPGHAPGHE
jgi:hypothetical protein